MFKYEPSAGVLDETFKTLVSLRQTLRKSAIKLDEENRNLNGFHGGIGIEDDEREKLQRDWDSRYDGIHAQIAIIDNLLLPFDNEYRRGIEDHERRACDRMMHL